MQLLRTTGPIDGSIPNYKIINHEPGELGQFDTDVFLMTIHSPSSSSFSQYQHLHNLWRPEDSLILTSSHLVFTLHLSLSPISCWANLQKASKCPRAAFSWNFFQKNTLVKIATKGLFNKKHYFFLKKPLLMNLKTMSLMKSGDFGVKGVQKMHLIVCN